MSPQVWPVVPDDTGWITPTLTNGTSVGPGETIQYRRRYGVVYIRGRWNKTSGGSVIFTFPTGFRPSVQMVYRLGNNTTTEIIVLRTTGVLEQATSANSSVLMLAEIPPFIAEA